MNEIPKTDQQVRVEIARDADAILENRAFKVMLALLHKQWYGELVSDMTDESKVSNLRAKLQVLEAMPQVLRSLMADPQFAQRGVNVGRRIG